MRRGSEKATRLNAMCYAPDMDTKKPSRKPWLKWAGLAFSVAIVVKALLEHRPHRLVMIGMMTAIFVAVVAMGWMFANKGRR